MGWTKRQFVAQAFEEIGLATYVFDLQPQQLHSALHKLDAMMALWNGKGIRLGYPLPSNPQDSDLDEETPVPDSAHEAIYTNLALRIAGSLGRQPQDVTKVAARAGYEVLLSRAAMPMEQQFPGTLPIGSGGKPWGGQSSLFVHPPNTPVLAGQDGPIDLN